MAAAQDLLAQIEGELGGGPPADAGGAADGDASAWGTRLPVMRLLGMRPPGTPLTKTQTTWATASPVSTVGVRRWAGGSSLRRVLVVVGVSIIVAAIWIGQGVASVFGQHDDYAEYWVQRAVEPGELLYVALGTLQPRVSARPSRTVVTSVSWSYRSRPRPASPSRSSTTA